MGWRYAAVGSTTPQACMNGYSKLVAGTNVSLMVFGLTQRRRFSGPPALSFVPDASA
jgi:hypothetical protein